MSINFQKPNSPNDKLQAMRRPERYHLVVMDDPYTKPRQAALLLSRHFNVDSVTAHRMVQLIHERGNVVFTGKSYDRDVAETKQQEIMGDAWKYYGSPLMVGFKKV